MDNANVLNQMAGFDFSSPINVTMIFEDSDDDASYEETEQNNIKDDNKNEEVYVERCESECLKDDTSSETEIDQKKLNKSTLSLNKNKSILKKSLLLEEISEKNAKNISNNCKMVETRQYTNDQNLQNISNLNQPASITTPEEDTVNSEESLYSIHQVNDEPVTTAIEDLLNTLSKHIVQIMESFYHYGSKRKTNIQDSKKREKIFNFIKNHIFELSYTTVESMILPQEQNSSFINKFLESTAQIANKKSLVWKCNSGHIKPFFNELVLWTRQKRDYIRKNNLHRPTNDHIHLKRQLIKPLQPLHHPHTKTTPTSNIVSPNTQNNLCIFSSGTPGSEISINIDTNTLRNLQTQLNGNENNYAPRGEFTSRNTSIPAPPNENHFNSIQKKNTSNDRPPPSYDMHQQWKRFTNRPRQEKHMHINQNYLYGRQPHQNHQSITQTNQHYPTQVHYINSNQTSPVNDHLNSSLHNNLNLNAPTDTCGAQFGERIYFHPVITNVTSYNPTTRLLRCNMCGKNFSTLPTPYNPPSRTTYCSYLCQELDSQFYKPAWANT